VISIMLHEFDGTLPQKGEKHEKRHAGQVYSLDNKGRYVNRSEFSQESGQGFLGKRNNYSRKIVIGRSER
jgi:hypothetical protein